MAKQSSGASGARSGSRRGRRAPTIDLSAEEVKRGGAAEESTAGEEAAAAPEAAPAGAGQDADAAEERTSSSSEGGERERPDKLARETEPAMPSAFAVPPGTAAGHAAEEPSSLGRGALAAGLLGAALAGGLIVLAGLVLLDRAGLLPLTDRAEETAALRGQVAALEEELAAARQAAELEGEDLQAQLADLNERLAVLAEAAPAEGAPPEPAAPEPALAEEVAALQTALAALRDELGALSAPAALQAVGERLEALEQLPERVAALSDRVAALQAAPGDGAGEAVATEISGLAERLGEVEERLAGLAQRTESAASAEALEDVRAQLTAALQDTEAELSAAVDDARAELGEVARQLSPVQAAVAADALAAALASGRPFSSELQAISALGVDDAALSDLAPHAETGLPDRARLRRQFSDIARELRQTDAPPPSDAGPLERLMQSARNIVEVRPAGPQPGDSAGAVASRIEAALAAGDLARALEEWQDLPPEAQAASRQWADEAGAVLAGEALAARLRREALARLAERG